MTLFFWHAPRLHYLWKSILLLLFIAHLCACTTGLAQVEGIIWQPDNQTARPHGHWEQLGIKKLLVQWSIVDNYEFIPGCGTTPITPPTDWNRIAKEPWAQEVILGLAGGFNERQARTNLPALIDQSLCIAALPPPAALNIKGWYFPVEIDPSWDNAPMLAPLLNKLPRPLWVSVYDNSNIGATALGEWLQRWLPKDIGIFFQDGVGTEAREPRIAAVYAAALQRRFGAQHFRLIAETFRPAEKGGFRAATTAELIPQLQAYRGQQIYLFEGPHYISDETIQQLRPYFTIGSHQH